MAYATYTYKTLDCINKPILHTMKRLTILSTLVILAGLFACQPPVTFSEPQPTDTDNLSKFPKRLQGQYLNLDDSSTLLVGDKVIRRVYDYTFKVHPNQFDSTSKLVGDSIVDLDTHERFRVKLVGDSLVGHRQLVDTLFRLSYDNVVRKMKGYYFLNTRTDNASWVVQTLQLRKGLLVVSSISAKEDIDKLKALTEIPQDTLLHYKVTITKKQMKEFVRNGGFADRERYVKVKNVR